ncbi:hypothetical protein HY212_03445 [Candidatus Pacearchaeota archaeon]|nr:hypothetical protein [Candidatus Pacearchaeota archaeon]
MGDGNYDKIIEKISRISGLEKEEIERRVEAKRARLSGLISKEGASQVVAAELGISFDNEKLKIDELLPGMRKANVTGKVVNLFPVRTFTTKKGDRGKVVNLVLADDTANIKVVLWDTHHIGLVENNTISEGSVIEIINASTREGELHLGSFSELKLSNEVFESVKKEKVMKEKKISEFKVSDAAKVRAFIVQAFEPRFFYVCPECRKKVVSGAEGFVCDEHGKIAAEKRALMNFVLDDGSETTRAVVFNEALADIGISDLDNIESLILQRENILGKEMVFSGNVRMNKFFNNPEFVIDQVKDVDLDGLINELGKN